MRMKIFTLLIALLLSSAGSFAQTAKIAHRSHSGSDKTFRITGNDNWGIPTTTAKARIAKRDSLSKNRADSIARKGKTDSMAKKPTPYSLRRATLRTKGKAKPVK